MVVLESIKQYITKVRVYRSTSETYVKVWIKSPAEKSTIKFTSVTVYYNDIPISVTDFSSGHLCANVLRRYYKKEDSYFLNIDALVMYLWVYSILTGSKIFDLLVETALSAASTTQRLKLADMLYWMMLKYRRVMGEFWEGINYIWIEFHNADLDRDVVKEFINELESKLLQLKQDFSKRKSKILQMLEDMLYRVTYNLKKYVIKYNQKSKYFDAIEIYPFDNYIVITTSGTYGLVEGLKNALDSAKNGNVCATVKVQLFVVYVKFRGSSYNYHIKEFPYWRGIKVETLYKILTGKYKPSGQMAKFESMTVDKFIKYLEKAKDIVDDFNCKFIIDVALKYAKIYAISNKK